VPGSSETQPNPVVLSRYAAHWEQHSYWFQESVVGFELQVGQKECHEDVEKLDAATKDRGRQTTLRMSENVFSAVGQ
jgi:hypothetical protein